MITPISNTARQAVPGQMPGAASAASRLNFGMNASAGSSAGSAKNAKPIGLRKALFELFRHLRHSENRQLIKGMFYHYACSFGVIVPLLLTLGPLGWALAVPASVLSLVLPAKGKKILDSVDPAKSEGPVRTLKNIFELWGQQDQIEEAPRKIVNQLKQLLDQLLPENDTHAATAREGLKKFMDGSIFNWLNRAYLTRRSVSNSFSGKLLKGINSVAAKIPFKPLRIPLRVISYAIQALMMLMHPNIVKKAAAGAMRRL